MQRVDLARCSFYDVSPGLIPTVDRKLIVVVEEWRGLVPAGNGPSGLSPTDIPLVDNRRKKSGKIPSSVYLSRIPASQAKYGLIDLVQKLLWIAHRRMSCSFYPCRKD